MRLLEDLPVSSESSLEEKWHFVKSCMVLAAERSVGRGRRKKSEWFKESKDQELVPLIEAKNATHIRILQSGSRVHQLEFRRSQRVVKKAVDRAREEWVHRIALEGEAAVKVGRTRWDSILGSCGMLVLGVDLCGHQQC